MNIITKAERKIKQSSGNMVLKLLKKQGFVECST
uniref:Uncharacterized protein n=1 Tax=Rhizophora mucronata TaxID=61149 RepID=A0A2P2R2Y4_RHIMU